MLVALYFNNLTLGPKKILQLFGLKKALEIMTPRELRRIFAKYNQAGWPRLMAAAGKIQLRNFSSPFKEMREQLEEFKPLRRIK